MKHSDEGEAGYGEAGYGEAKGAKRLTVFRGVY